MPWDEESQSLEANNVVEHTEKAEPSHIMDRNAKGTVVVENTLMISYKVKCKITAQSHNSTPRFIYKRINEYFKQIYVHICL